MALTLRGNGQITSDNYTIDSDGDVSISGTLTTTSTGTTLSSNSYNVVKIQTDKDDTAAADGLLQFTHGSANTVKGEIRYDASESMFELGHGDNQGHIRINSSGEVLKPSTPHMLAQGYKERYGTTDRHLFRTITTNTGNHWNNTNGKFTCPVAGTYLVTAFSGYKEADNYAGIGIGYNGSVLSFGWSHPTDDRHGTQNVTIMKNASANDYFYYYAHTSYTSPIVAAGNEHHAHFSVYLLG